MARRDDTAAGARVLEADVELNRLLADTVHAGIFYQDHVSGEHVWSDAIYDFLELPDSFEVSAESFMKLVFPEDIPPILDLVTRAHADTSRGGYVLDFRMRRGDGVWRNVRATCHFDRSAEGLVIRERGVLADLTERRELERALISAQRSGAVGRIAAGVAHDFNNVLSGILGEASLQLMDPLPPEQTAAFESIIELTERATTLTNQLLAFTRQQVVQLAILDLNVAIAEFGQLLRRIINERLTLELELELEAIPVRVDRVQLEQVVVNLVANARDAIAASGGTIVIETRLAEDSGGRWAVLSVRDDGEGMSAEVLDRAQEEFFTTKPHAAGLGLPISRQIVTELGGQLSIESEAGLGTQVVIRLPGLEPSALEPRRELPKDKALGAGVRVLVVDDEPLLVKLALRGLRGFGFEAEGMIDRDEALRWLDEHADSLDVLVADVVMPGMRFDEFLAEFHARCPRAGLVAVSGYAPSENEHDPIPPDALFVAKPFTPAGLARAVETASRG